MELVVVVLCVGHDFTCQHCTTVVTAQRIEFINTLFGIHAPSQIEVGRKHFLRHFWVDSFVHSSSVCGAHIAHYGWFGITQLHNCEKGMRLQCFFACCIFFCRNASFVVLSFVRLERCQCVLHLSFSLLHCLRAVYFRRVFWRFARVQLSQTAVKVLECALHFTQCVSFPKLEVCATLEEFAHTFGFFDTRHFHHDLTHLSATLKDLDVGLSHTEAVNTLLHHLVGVAHRCFNLFFESNFHLCVCAVGGDAFFFETKGEESTELVGTYLFLILCHKDIEEVFRSFGCFSLRFGNNLLHFGIFCATASEVFHHIGHRHFENHVHTTLEVKTQANLKCLTLLVALSQPYALVALTQRVKVCFACFHAHSFSLLFVVVSHETETQIVDADKAKQYGDYFDKSFVLHLNCCLFYCCLISSEWIGMSIGEQLSLPSRWESSPRYTYQPANIPFFFHFSASLTWKHLFLSSFVVFFSLFYCFSLPRWTQIGR